MGSTGSTVIAFRDVAWASPCAACAFVVALNGFGASGSRDLAQLWYSVIRVLVEYHSKYRYIHHRLCACSSRYKMYGERAQNEQNLAGMFT